MHAFLQLGDFGKTWQIAAKCGRRKELVKFNIVGRTVFQICDS